MSLIVYVVLLVLPLKFVVLMTKIVPPLAFEASPADPATSPEDAGWTLAETSYGTDFCSAVWKDNIFATQFHPEKSQAAGLRLIQNFVASPKAA